MNNLKELKAKRNILNQQIREIEKLEEQIQLGKARQTYVGRVFKLINNEYDVDDIYFHCTNVEQKPYLIHGTQLQIGEVIFFEKDYVHINRIEKEATLDEYKNACKMAYGMMIENL